MSSIEWIKERVDGLPYKNWQIYLLMLVTLISAAMYFQVRLVTDVLYSIDDVQIAAGLTVSEILVKMLQTAVIGILGALLISQGDEYFKFFGNLFDSKETAFAAKIGLISLIGILGAILMPGLINAHFEFVSLQTLGLVLLIGYGLIHYEIVNWKLSNELPVLIAGLLLFAAPFFI